MYDIIIIGAGPAGLTSALYALRANKKVLLLEAKSYGGQIINARKIENYPGIDEISGFDFANNLYEQVKKFGGTIKYETVLRVNEDKEVTTNKDTYKSKAVIIATGSANKKLNIKGEEEFIGKGVSYCATCDGNFFKGKNVAIVGSTLSTVDDALYLSEVAHKVYLISDKDQLENEEKINNVDNIEVINSAIVEEIKGENILNEITIRKNETSTGIKVDGVFIDIGRTPKNEIFKNIVDLTDQGYIASTDGVHTKTKGIYVAGDTREKELRQLTTAVADGSLAATIAIKELNI